MVETQLENGGGIYGEPAAAMVEETAGLIDRAGERARRAAEDTAARIAAQPYAAVTFATLAGLALGLLLGASRREVIYLRE